MGALVRNVPINHPEFGKAVTCPECGGGPKVVARRQRALEDQFGDVWMAPGRKLRQHDLADFLELDDSFMAGKMDAINAAYDWAQGVGDPFCVLVGDPGMGKTCLAAAAYVERVSDTCAGIPIEYNAMMNMLLDCIRQDRSPTTVVNTLASVPVLFLDDMGNTFRSGAETDGRQAWLFDIINRRDDRQLPTLITSNLSVSAMMTQFDRKTIERILENCEPARMGGRSLRLPDA